MAAPKPRLNPFHFLLGVMGLVFTITAISVTVRLTREDQLRDELPRGAEPDLRQHPLMLLMKEHGEMILLYEVGIIGILAAGAIGLDRWRDVKQQKQVPQTLPSEQKTTDP